MPKVSVIIPLYNVGHDIDRCLASVCGQTHRDLEALVVDDASTDECAELAHAWETRDERVRVISHEHNSGLHLARKTGVAAMRGTYALFLDSDDEFCDETVIERLVAEMERDPVDVLRFGLEAVAIDGTSEDEARQLSAWSSVPMERLTGNEAARRAFLSDEHNVLPWHVTHRVFAAPVLTEAFSRMVGERLERAEDAYEYLVISSLAKSERAVCDIVGYRYYLGGGVMNARALPASKFHAQADAIRACYEAAEAYAADLADENFKVYATDLKRKLLETVGTMWHERVADLDKPQAAHDLALLLGVDETCAELFRFVRDRAYEFVAAGSVPSPDDELFLLLGLANLTHGMGVGAGPEHERAEAMRTVALGHVSELLAPRAALEAARSEAEARSALLEEQLRNVQGSVSFRIGKNLTAPVRAARSLVAGRGHSHEH